MTAFARVRDADLRDLVVALDDATDVLENWACASTLQDIGFDFAHQPSHSAGGFNGLAAVETYDQLRNNLVDVLRTIKRAAAVLAELRGGGA